MSKEYYKDSYLDAKTINDGELIQVVFSQRLSRYTELNHLIYIVLRAIKPFYTCFLHLDDFNIVGASPELLTQVIDKKMECTYSWY